MLVLSRKVGEEIQIGDNVSIVINRVSGDRVSIGIKAPQDVRIMRGELNEFADESETIPLGEFDLSEIASLTQPDSLAS